MQLDILTPEKKIFQGEVYGIIVPGVAGYFELLNNHAPLVAALKAGELKILKDKTNTSETYTIDGGFIETNNNKTIVLLEGVKN